MAQRTSFFLSGIAGFLISTSAFADTTLVLSPGASTKVQAGQTVTVTCSGSSLSSDCVCEVESLREDRWIYKIKKSGATIGGSYGSYNREIEAGRACFAAIESESLCK